MPMNPSRKDRGGDVGGETKTDVVLGSPLDVSNASFDPGYDLSTTLANGHVSKADLKQGFCSYGKGIGE